ncbi:MAG: bifunctional riboflavin kinase/FAD synthetase [Oscillospiraceae bacterium]|jgi:riboflavin kinase/FMN adenylyltransferase|nr:bifunctional riboflavin kinase/FAD synthetase [Oscillospiraceae bacterium]
MKTLTPDLLPVKEKTAIAVGMFDGVHKGHLRLVESILDKPGAAPLIFTFNTKPAADRLIFTSEEKKEIFDFLGVKYYYEQNFGEAFAGLSPEAFVTRLLNDFGMTHLAAGFDFRFGKDAAGNTKLLAGYAGQYGFTLDALPKVTMDGGKVSSSVIRRLIERGDMAGAAGRMGRFYFIDGRIETGRRLGNILGFPTANIHTKKLLPKRGVYATIVKLPSGRRLRAVTNVGVKPTVQAEGAPNVETFILDFDGDIYGERIRVCFVDFIRAEKRFASLEKLKAQIAADSGNAANKLADLSVYNAYIM